ncbi:MAG: hypothetical protein HY897_12330 [Deltaproteobacteria bacterium]|nr:hypothetical protein [Deltaproteobacteria bacterium]
MKRGLAFAVFGVLAAVAAAIPLDGCGCGGSSCTTSADCETGEVCVAEICVTGTAMDPDSSFPPYDNTQVGCSTDDQCGPCEVCSSGLCAKDEKCDAGSVQWPDGGAAADGGDAGPTDGGDAETPDGGDAETPDAGDAGPTDGGDAEMPDGGDAGPSDAGDAGPADAGDAGPVDAGADGGTDGGDCDAGSLPKVQVANISPGTGRLPRGKQITLSGQGFDPVCNGNQVFFTGDPNPAPVISVTSTQLKVRISRYADTGILTVKVGANEDKSQAVTVARRLFLTREGSAATPGQTFTPFNVELMLAQGTFAVGQTGQPVKLPTAIVLNPKQWKIYIISADPADEAHAVSVHDYAELSHSSTVALTGAGPGYAGILDEDQDRLLVSHSSGKLSAANTVTEGVANGSPVTLGSAAWGLDLDAKNGRYYVGATHQATGNGIIAIVNRADLSAAAPLDLGAGVVPMDVKYDPDNDRIYAVDFAGAKLHVYDAGTLQKVGASPVTISGATGPMSLSFGGTGADRKVFVACSNNVDHMQFSPHAAIAVFAVSDLQPVAGSPVDVGIVTTSVDQAGDFDQVRTFYDRRDNYVFVTSDFDKGFGVLNPDLIKVTIGSNTSPFQAPYTNLGIAVEDW